jgi:hypothetical protein
MTLQANLFGSMPEQNANKPVHNGTKTSRAASSAIAGSVKTLRGRVYAHLLREREKGATDEEMQFFLGMPGNTQRPRRQELETQGLVIDSGLTRATSSGRLAVVWVCREFAPKKERN